MGRPMFSFLLCVNKKCIFLPPGANTAGKGVYRMMTAFFRTVILYLLLIVGLRLTGKRQIGELEPIEPL